jgi:hypothetical protein
MDAVDNPFLSGQPLIETWAAHGQPCPFWISESPLYAVPVLYIQCELKPALVIL